MDFSNIRKARKSDLSRIAEIYVFNNRLSYFSIFNDIDFSFRQLQVISYANKLEEKALNQIFVYDDGVIKGFVLIDQEEIRKLHIDYFFHKHGIGGCLLEYSVRVHNASYLWTLEKNMSAIGFYKKHGFEYAFEKKVISGLNGNEVFLIKMYRKKGR